MPHVSKRRKAMVGKVDRNKSYPAADALKIVKESATAKVKASDSSRTRSSLAFVQLCRKASRVAWSGAALAMTRSCRK